MEKLSFKDKLALLNQNLGNKPIIKQIITMPDDETLHQRKTTVVLKNKVKEKDIIRDSIKENIIKFTHRNTVAKKTTKIEEPKENKNVDIVPSKEIKKEEIIVTKVEKQPETNSIKNNDIDNKNNEIKVKEEPNIITSKKEEKIEIDVSKDIPEISEFSRLSQKKIEQYHDQIKNNPDKLFSIITKETVSKWLDVLSTVNGRKSITNITEIYKIKDVPNLKIIQNDIIRTRVKESALLPSFKELLEFFIIYFCKINNIKYKQGLNEIIGPMILLTYKVQLTLSEIYSLIQGFVNLFLTNYYHEIELFSLKSSMSLIKLLLRYHDPVMFNLLESQGIAPEMYSMSMLMTTFAGKMQIDYVYKLWNYLITEKDNLLMHYFVVAFLQIKRNYIEKSEPSLIVVVISQLAIDSLEELEQIYQRAIELRSSTPYSFRVLSNKLQIFKENSTELQKMYEIIKPDNFIAMPIFPNEIFYITYHGIMKCPDEECITTKENVESILNVNITSKEYNCEHCDMKIEKEIKYVLLDLRILEYGTFENMKEKTGFLPNMIMVEQKELKRQDFHEKINERFITDKGQFHFVFLTSKTDYFREFENNYYIEPEKQEENKFTFMNVNSVKVEKALDVKKSNQIASKEKYKLKEYDNLKKTIETLLTNNYPYISYVYGGFVAIHEQSVKYEIGLLNHDPKCYLCKEMRRRDSFSLIQKLSNFYHQKNEDEERLKERKNIAEVSKPTIENTIQREESKTSPKTSNNILNIVPDEESILKIKEITKIISNTEFNSYFCLLKQHKGKIFTENFQIMVMIKNDELEIYQFNKGNDNNMELMKIESINLKSILSITSKKMSKSVLYLNYYIAVSSKRKSKVEETIIIDFLCDQDSRKFIYAINQNKQMLRRNSRNKKMPSPVLFP